MDDAEPCTIQSIRTARRAGPDGQVLFDLVAELTQRRQVVEPGAGGLKAKFFGGPTVIIGPEGDIRHIIRKNVLSPDGLERQLAYQRTSGFWVETDGRYAMRDYAYRLAHARPPTLAG